MVAGAAFKLHKSYAFLHLCQWTVMRSVRPRLLRVAQLFFITSYYLGTVELTLVRLLGHPKLDIRDASANPYASCPDVLSKRGNGPS